MSSDHPYPPQGHPHGASAAGGGLGYGGPGANPWGTYPGSAPAPYPPPGVAAGYLGPAGPARGPGASDHRPRGAFLNLGNDRFLKGLLIGAAATYLLTNEQVQSAAIKGAVKVWSLLQGGVEEIKERFQDAEAELRAAEAGPAGDEG